MHVSVKLVENNAGGYPADSYVASVAKHKYWTSIAFTYTGSSTGNQGGASIQLGHDEAEQLAKAILAVSSGYTNGKAATFTVEDNKIRAISLDDFERF